MHPPCTTPAFLTLLKLHNYYLCTVLYYLLSILSIELLLRLLISDLELIFLIILINSTDDYLFEALFKFIDDKISVLYLFIKY